MDTILSIIPYKQIYHVYSSSQYIAKLLREGYFYLYIDEVDYSLVAQHMILLTNVCPGNLLAHVSPSPIR